MADIRRLPVPVADLWEWQLRGACRDLDSALFFHPEGARGPTRSAREVHAQSICATCPVLQACRRHALSVQEPYGVWGGLTESDRMAMLHPHRRAHPRYDHTRPQPA